MSASTSDFDDTYGIGTDPDIGEPPARFEEDMPPYEPPNGATFDDGQDRSGEQLSPGASVEADGIVANPGRLPDDPHIPWTPERLIAAAEANGIRSKGKPSSKADTQPAQNVAAEQLASGITQTLCRILEINPDDDLGKIGQIGINVEVLHSIVTGCFWSGAKAKVFMLGSEDDLLQFTKEDAAGFIIKRFGGYFDAGAVTAMATDLAGQKGLTIPQTEKLVGTACGAPGAAIISHLKYHNQRDSLEWRVDMFADESRIQIIEDKVRVTIRHRPLSAGASLPSKQICEDYLEHFPRLNAFIDLLVAARFAGDRKKAYLWLFASTDWGKGLLLGALSQLGLVVNLSVKEVEAMFEGKPVGRSPLDFKRAFILAIDEFKTVKAELKQLQSTIELAPKHQLTSSVEVFTKLFLSAESVGSLVGENGVEDQFANRMSIFKEHGSIENRPLFKEVGKDAYRNAIANYIADAINESVCQFRGMGREQATKAADAAVTEFHRVHGLDTVYKRFSDSLPDMAEQFLRWLSTRPSAYTQQDGIRTYLLKANRAIDEFIDDHLTQSEAGAMRRKKPEIIDLISADGKGVRTYRIHGHPTAGVMLR